MGAASILSPRNIVGEYYRVLEETRRASWLDAVANFFTSDQKQETYPFLHEVPALREWIGPRRRKEPTGDSLAVTNLKHESGLEISKDDLRRDKTPQTMARVGDLGSRVAQFPAKLISDALVANGNAYDGISFFGTHNAADRPQITNAQSVAAASGTTPTAAEAEEGILTAVQTILGAVDSEGEPSNADARRFLVMVPTVYWSAHIAALRDEYTASGVSNTLRSAILDGFGIQLAVNPRIAAPYAYVFRSDARIRSAIVQEEDNEVQALTDGSDFAVWNDAHFYGVKWQGNAALGRYDLACRIEYT